MKVTAHEWENEILPPRPRGVALFRLLPDPIVVAMVVTGAAGVVADESWLLWLAVGIGVFALIHMVLDNRYGVNCEPVDHWVGDGPVPEGLTLTCPDCREIPFRVLWRAARVNRHARWMSAAWADHVSEREEGGR